MSETLTPSELLRRIAAIKGDIARWTALYRTSNVWSENTPRPAYREGEVRAELDAATEALIKYKTALAVVNATTWIKLPGTGRETPLVEAIFRLAENKSRQTTLEALDTRSDKESTVDQRGYVGDKIETVKVKVHSALTTRERDDQLRALRAEFAAINALIERTNNTVTVTID